MDLKTYITQFPKNERKAVREELAKAVGVAEPTVRSWANGNRQIPAATVRALVRATKGKVSRYELRPDVYGRQPEKRKRAAA